jgi:hypothetical protein
MKLGNAIEEGERKLFTLFFFPKFTAMDRKKKIRKIFNLPEEKLPF